MPFSTFYLPSSFCSHFLLSSILLFFSSQLSHWISKSRCHQTKISHSCRDWQIIALRLLCPFSPHLFNFSSFFSTFFSPLLFLCLPFSPHFHFSSFFSTPLPFSLPSFLFLLFSTSFPHIPHFSWKKVQTISISPICVSPASASAALPHLCSSLHYQSHPFCSTWLLESFENKACSVVTKFKFLHFLWAL